MLLDTRQPFMNRVQKVFHCNYLIYNDLEPFLTKVVAICPLNHYPLRTMKQKLWITLFTYLAYCIDKELYKAIDYLREQVRVLVEQQEKHNKRILLTNSQRMRVAAKAKKTQQKNAGAVYRAVYARDCIGLVLQTDR